MKLTGKSPLKQVKSELNRVKGKSVSDEEKDIGRVVARQQFDLFKSIVQEELPKLIVELDGLRRNQFKHEQLMKKCLCGASELQQHLLAPHSRSEVDAYLELYSLADFSDYGFLFPKGSVPVNNAVVEMATILLEHLHTLGEHCSQCVFALNLAVPPYEKRTAFEYSLLEEIKSEFEAVGSWAKHGHTEQSTLFLNWHASEMVNLMRTPQYEDRTKAYLRGEQVQIKAFDVLLSQLFFYTVNLYETVCKNGHKLGPILSKARTAT